MREQYEALAKAIEQGLTQEEEEKREAENRQESIRQLLVIRARERLQAYEVGREEKIAILQDRYQDVLLPWWETLHTSGLHEQLVKYHKTRKNLVRLNTPVTYYWPHGLYSTFGSVRQGIEPFSFTAESVLKEALPDNTAIEQDIREKLDNYWHCHWRANIYVSSSQEPETLYVSQYPPGGGGCGFNSEAFKARIKLGGERLSLGSLDPSPLLTLADQVVDGTVARNIQEAFRAKR